MPAIPVLSISDAGDDTGGTATITGSTALSSNVIYTMPPSTGTWTNQGSRTADGTVTITATAGYYWCYCASTLAGVTVVSNLVFAGFTSTTLSLATRIRNAVESGLQNIIAAGKLPGLTANSQIIQSLVPDPKLVVGTWPVVFLCPPFGGRETIQLVVNDRDDLGYPTQLVFADRYQDSVTAPTANLELRRERAGRYFRSQRLSGVSDVFLCVEEPGPIFEFKPTGGYEYITSSLILRYKVREQRSI